MILPIINHFEKLRLRYILTMITSRSIFVHGGPDLVSKQVYFKLHIFLDFNNEL